MAKVDSISKFGFVADGKQYKYADVSVPRVSIVPGSVIDLGAPMTQPVDTERAMKVVDAVNKTFVPKFHKVENKTGETMSKADWSAKDRSQMIGGLSHDAATIAVAVLNLDGSNEPGTESALRVYKTLLEGMLKIREEVK